MVDEPACAMELAFVVKELVFRGDHTRSLWFSFFFGRRPLFLSECSGLSSFVTISNVKTSFYRFEMNISRGQSTCSIFFVRYSNLTEKC